MMTPEGKPSNGEALHGSEREKRQEQLVEWVIEKLKILKAMGTSKRRAFEASQKRLREHVSGKNRVSFFEDLDEEHLERLLDAWGEIDAHEDYTQTWLTQEYPAERLVKFLEDPEFLPKRELVRKAFSSRHAKTFFCEGFRKTPEGEEIFVYEIWTEEYIQRLADHFSPKIEQKRHAGIERFRILEVGAGDGKLAHFLGSELKRRYGDDAVEVIATDPEENVARVFPVGKLSYEDALEQYSRYRNVDAVLASWMSPQEDWTAAFRNPKYQIPEYILIGEEEPGVSGTEETWNEALVNSEGYMQTTLTEPTREQISHTDHEDADRYLDSGSTPSRTISFERMRIAT